MTKKDLQGIAIMAGWFILLILMSCADSIVDKIANFIFGY